MRKWSVRLLFGVNAWLLLFVLIDMVACRILANEELIRNSLDDRRPTTFFKKGPLFAACTGDVAVLALDRCWDVSTSVRRGLRRLLLDCHALLKIASRETVPVVLLAAKNWHLETW